MPDRWSGRIPPGKALLRDHPGHIGQPHQHLVILFGPQSRGNLDRLVAVRLVELVLQILHLHRRESQQPRQFGHGPIGIDQALGDNVDPEFDPVAGKLRVVAIKDRPAPWRQQGQVDAIAFGKRFVLGVLDEPDPAHPRRQQHAKAGLQAADQH